MQGCPKLRKLSMPENNLYMIEDEVFSDLPNLEELYLAKNKISELPKLQSNPKLKKFCISYNTIDSVPTGAFKGNILAITANNMASSYRMLLNYFHPFFENKLFHFQKIMNSLNSN